MKRGKHTRQEKLITSSTPYSNRSAKELEMALLLAEMVKVGVIKVGGLKLFEGKLEPTYYLVPEAEWPPEGHAYMVARCEYGQN